MSVSKMLALCVLAAALLGADANVSMLGVRGRGRSLLTLTSCSDLKTCLTTVCNGDGTASYTLNENCIKTSSISNIRLYVTTSTGTQSCLYTADGASGLTPTGTVPCGSTLTLIVHDGSIANPGANAPPLSGCVYSTDPSLTNPCGGLNSDNKCAFCVVSVKAPDCATTCTPQDTCHTAAPSGCSCIQSPKTCTVSISANPTTACPGSNVVFTASSTDCATSPLTVSVGGTTITADANGNYNYQIPATSGCGTTVTATASVCSATNTAAVNVGAPTPVTITPSTTSACPGAAVTFTTGGGCGTINVTPQNTDGSHNLGSTCGSNTFTATDSCGNTATATITATDSITKSCSATSCAPVFTSACTGAVANPTPDTHEDGCSITKTYTVQDQCAVSYSETITFTGTCPAR